LNLARQGFVALAVHNASLKFIWQEKPKMFCPSCGQENAQSQKFCRRCGANLQALQAATEMVSGMAQGQMTNHLDPKFALKIIAALGITGFFFITGGAIALTAIQATSSPESFRHDPPYGIFLAVFGYSALVWLCRMLMKWASATNSKPALPVFNQPVSYAPPVNQMAPPSAVGANTNPALNAAPAYQSIVEDETRQFIKQPQPHQ
jgi:zinc-ribbon domain